MYRHLLCALPIAIIGTVALAQDTAAPSSAPAAATSAAPELAGDPTAGKTVFVRCTSCHDIGDGAGNRMGPALTGVVGRPAASFEGFTYSQAMIAAAENGLVWTPDALDAFLQAPHDYVPGTKMPNVPVKDDTQRADLIAYLATFSPGFDPATAVNTYTPPSASAEGAAPAGDTSNTSAPAQ